MLTPTILSILVPTLSPVLSRPTVRAQKRAGRDRAGRRARARGSFRPPTPRARPVHGVGAPASCHGPAGQGSLGRAPARAASRPASAAAASSSPASRPAGAAGGELGLAAVVLDQRQGGARVRVVVERAAALGEACQQLGLEPVGAGGAQPGGGEGLGEVAGAGARGGEL